MTKSEELEQRHEDLDDAIERHLQQLENGKGPVARSKVTKQGIRAATRILSEAAEELKA